MLALILVAFCDSSTQLLMILCEAPPPNCIEEAVVVDVLDDNQATRAIAGHGHRRVRQLRRVEVEL